MSYDAAPRPLPYPLDRASNLEVVVPEDTFVCGIPEFPEDSDEKIPVVFNLSLNDFVALATSIDVGSDIAYGDDGLKIWYLWVASVMCANFCDEVAECIDNSENVQTALANQIRNNPLLAMAIADAIGGIGGFTPGVPISPEQATSDITPGNIHDGDTCDLNASWGAALYLTQSANRLITDFFESTETLTNVLERMQKLVGLIPAIGNTIENLASFADELYDDLKEGYAGAYNETVEEQIACDIFCVIQENCTLTVDDLIQIFADRLGTISPTVFASVITFVGTGTFVGTPIVDAMYYLYFTAMKFGQVFGSATSGMFGIRPLTQLMGLGADQLASDNWITLCDCPTPCEPSFKVVNPLGFSGGSFDLTDNMDGTWTLVMTAAFDTNAYRLGIVEDDPTCCWRTLSVSYSHEPENLNAQYNCGAEPTDSDYSNGIGTGALTVGLCAAGVIASDVDEAFQITWTFEAC